MESLIIFVHVLAAIGITGLVLIQHGKGADMGASFGSGASQTIFGSVGSGNALTKSTSWLATVFFVTSLVLALFAKQQSSQGIEDEGLIQNTGVLNETPAAAADLPVVENAASDIPQATTEQAAPEDVPTDAALEAAPTATVEGEAADQEADAEAAGAAVEEPAEVPAQ
jgi:preprotein translocase subunit SecG